ncbi:MAG: prepilin-type N-terminal cleavage/methylation domain-containing protein [Pirellulales bacterium]|nr:prepilin-type N-terminal cleavage/methylation domain-containing protein [Pirellulales bacterium]
MCATRQCIENLPSPASGGRHEVVGAGGEGKSNLPSPASGRGVGGEGGLKCAAPASPHPRIPTSPPPKAFTLVEVMVVLIVVAVLTALGIPSFQRALEQSRVDVASANLRAVWSAQRLYWLEYHTYTGDLSGLQGLGMIDSEILGASSGFTYAATGSTDAFTATATRSGSTYWTGSLSIDQDGTVSGSTASGSGTVITPGYQ